MIAKNFRPIFKIIKFFCDSAEILFLEKFYGSKEKEVFVDKD